MQAKSSMEKNVFYMKKFSCLKNLFQTVYAKKTRSE